MFFGIVVFSGSFEYVDEMYQGNVEVEDVVAIVFYFVVEKVVVNEFFFGVGVFFGVELNDYVVNVLVCIVCYFWLFVHDL